MSISRDPISRDEDAAAQGQREWRPGDGWPLPEAETTDTATCSRCKRGAEACGYCEGIEERDWEAICDCGLYDFGDHLLDCEARAAFKYVVAGDYGQAKVPRA